MHSDRKVGGQGAAMYAKSLSSSKLGATQVHARHLCGRATDATEHGHEDRVCWLSALAVKATE